MPHIIVRHALAANGIAADKNKQPLMFSKENNSNGDIATVDIIFPQTPMMLLFSVALAKISPRAAVRRVGALDVPQRAA